MKNQQPMYCFQKCNKLYTFMAIQVRSFKAMNNILTQVNIEESNKYIKFR